MENNLSLRKAFAVGAYVAIKKISSLLEWVVILLAIHIPSLYFSYTGNLNMSTWAALRFGTLFVSCLYTILVLLPILFGLFRTGSVKRQFNVTGHLVVKASAIALMETLNFGPWLLTLEPMETIHTPQLAGVILFFTVGILLILFLYPYLYFASCALIDKNVSIQDSLKISYRISSNHKLLLFGYLVLVAFLLKMSILTFVGYLMVPIVLLSRIYLYHALQGRENEMAKLD